MLEGPEAAGGRSRRAWLGALESVALMQREPTLTLPALVERVAAAWPERVALIGPDATLSYGALAERMRAVALWVDSEWPGSGGGRSEGAEVGKAEVGRAEVRRAGVGEVGDGKAGSGEAGFSEVGAGQGAVGGRPTIGLVTVNRVESVVLWLGMIRAGCTVALLNPNLRPEAVRHAVVAASCSAVVAGKAERSLAEAGGVPVLDPGDVFGGPSCSGAGTVRSEAGHEREPPTPGSRHRAGAVRAPGPGDLALLIFTSGTTGMPKAARLTHGRVLEWALWFAGMTGVAAEDRIYDCLPLYHSTGGVVAIGAALVRGASVVIAPGFSARRFWDEVVDQGCTIFFYIGELCRYLVGTEPHGRERAHSLRLAVGNGLQGAVWEAFQTRFAVPNILEFYAATEGGLSLYNCEGRPGAIGRIPPFLAARLPVALICVDAESGEPRRGADGLCQVCDAGEAGEAVAPLRRDAGDHYTDAAASARKVLRDVLAPGDRWFRSFDLMRRDAGGFYFFVDRLGETFRWKGENVSCTEVAAALRAVTGVEDAVVYGVAVPGQEGKAGMAAIVAGAAFELDGLPAALSERLPGYAQPVFLRLCAGLEMTGTFKLVQARLAAEGWTNSSDPVLVRQEDGYVPCAAGVVGAIRGGAMRV